MSTVPEGHVEVTEGKASILFGTQNEVFYNPPQVFNRDLSGLVLRLFAEDVKKEHEARVRKHAMRTAGDASEEAKEAAASAALKEQPFEGITVLEALSATGLRAIRYMKEVENIKHIVANDLDKEAVAAIRRNVAHNQLTDQQIIANEGDAVDVLYQHRSHDKRFHCIDLDPYGTAVPFIDGSVQAVSDGGLLCVTCTDMQVLCASYAETCYAKYGSMPLKNKFCHEMALRILLHTLETSATRYGRHIVPYISISIDFYIRVFVRVYTQPSVTKRSCGKRATVYVCMGCGTFHEQPAGKVTEKGNQFKYGPATGPPTDGKCSECGGRFHVGGPYYSAPIHNREFVSRCIDYLDEHPEMYASHKKMYGVLSMIRDEHEISLHYDLPALCQVLHCVQPSLAQFKSALHRLGYKCTQPYSHASGIKSDAPISVIWDVLRCWVKENPVKPGKPGSPGTVILSKEPSITCDFTPLHQFAKKAEHARYVINPDNWGPKARAGVKRKAEGEASKDNKKPSSS